MARCCRGASLDVAALAGLFAHCPAPRLALHALALCAVASPACAIAAPSAPHKPHPYAAHVAQAGERFGIPPSWIWSVMRQESGGNARARSRAGAQGLMQIMPATWTMLTARYNLGNDPYEVRANVQAGAAYLRLMWDRYRNVPLMLAAYNAGPGRTDDYIARRRRLPAETIGYVAAIAPLIGHPTGTKTADGAPLEQPDWRSARMFVARTENETASRPAASIANQPALGDSGPRAIPAQGADPRQSLFVAISSAAR